MHRIVGEFNLNLKKVCVMSDVGLIVQLVIDFHLLNLFLLKSAALQKGLNNQVRLKKTLRAGSLHLHMCK